MKTINFTIAGHLNNSTGLGRLTINIINAFLKETQYNFNIFPLIYNEDYSPISKDIKEKCTVNEISNNILYIDFPFNFAVRSESESFFKNKNIILFTLHEATKLRSSEIEALNKYCKLIIVPCKWCLNNFLKLNIKKDNIIHIPLYVSDTFFFKSKSESELTAPFVFGCGGRINNGDYRKGLGRIIKLFNDNFKYKNAVLKVKTLSPIFNYNNKNIIINSQFYTDSELLNWYQSLDCFISDSASEGWGFMQIQALACGIPLITANYSGISEYFDKRLCHSVKYTLSKAHFIFSNYGKWAIPNLNSILKKMYLVYNERNGGERSNNIKKIVSESILQKFSFNKFIKNLKNIINKNFA